MPKQQESKGKGDLGRISLMSEDQPDLVSTNPEGKR